MRPNNVKVTILVQRDRRCLRYKQLLNLLIEGNARSLIAHAICLGAERIHLWDAHATLGIKGLCCPVLAEECLRVWIVRSHIHWPKYLRN
jgi:hypothetical protein